MLYIPYYYFFFLILIIGSLLSISSSNWLCVWIGLEINLLSFIPFVIHGNEDLEVESIIKYFLIQSFGSCIILFIYFYVTIYQISGFFIGFYIILIFSFILKMGIFPFHFWLVQVMRGISWISCIVLSVWQKLAPLLVLRRLINSVNYILFFTLGSIGSVLGGVIGINQSYMRNLMAYSSISHIGWILSGIICSFIIFLFYFLVYSITTISIIFFLNIYNRRNINSINFVNYPIYILFSISILFLSLGGFPPFIGFYPKLGVIYYILNNTLFFDASLLVLGSLINIFFYLGIIFKFLIIGIFYGSFKYHYLVNGVSQFFSFFFICLSIRVFIFI